MLSSQYFEKEGTTREMVNIHVLFFLISINFLTASASFIWFNWMLAQSYK